MTLLHFFKIFILSLLYTACNGLFAQSQYQFDISKTKVECYKANASIAVSGDSSQFAIVSWSTGQTGVNSITDLDARDYSVNIKIPNKLDTTLYFAIEKEMCKISVPNFFSPNGDGHNDMIFIPNLDNYPNFEFLIFNKWGQRIHSQRSKHVPWDGTLAGIAVPDGTYYYVLFFDASDKNKLIKGDITILR